MAQSHGAFIGKSLMDMIAKTPNGLSDAMLFLVENYGPIPHVSVDSPRHPGHVLRIFPDIKSSPYGADRHKANYLISLYKGNEKVVDGTFGFSDTAYGGSDQHVCGAHGIPRTIRDILRVAERWP